VDRLSFAVERGEIFALLGPNGAGKTTTVEMLEGYRKPDSGTVRVLGYDPISQGREMKQHMGLMLQQTALYERIRVNEALDLFCSYYANPRNPDDLIKLIGLESHASSYFDNLSGGQKQRLSLGLQARLREPAGSLSPMSRLPPWTRRRQKADLGEYQEGACRRGYHPPDHAPYGGSPWPAMSRSWTTAS
jgi:ABC-2 type transport system ATP-binding protein